MDVDELFASQATKPNLGILKRKGDGLAEGDPKRGKKDDVGSRAVIDEEEKTKILDLVANDEVEPMDETSIKKMILKFEKRAYKNQESRVKYPDQPEKFMDSELELHEVIQEMHAIATIPDMYYILVDLNATKSLLQLLSHENTDISCGVVDLLQELTDVDTMQESEDNASTLIDALMDGQVVALLVQNLERLDETVKEEADGVHSTLGILENMMEFKPEIAVDASKQGMIVWLLKRIRAKLPFDANKLYASEILAIITQNSNETREQLGEADGVDILLQQLAAYKRHDPVTAEETEYMENVFDCLCSSLMLNSNRQRFLAGEGLQLMNLMLRERKLSRNSALRVLDHAMMGSEGKDNCQKFVDILGLRSIFPVFMKTPKITRKTSTQEELEEHIISIICSMVKNCSGQQRQRLLNKFSENDHEKVDRLMELHFKYIEKVNHVDNIIERQRNELRKYGQIDEETEEEYFSKRLDAGLFTLQLIDYIMLEISSSSISSIKQRVMQILNLRGGSAKSIRAIMREYAGNLGDSKEEPGEREEEVLWQNRVLELIGRF